MKFLGKYDPYILISLTAVMFLLLILQTSSNNIHGKIIVEIEGKDSYIFEKDGVYPIKDRKGNYLMTIEISKEKVRVRVIDSTCPDKLCVKSGWLESANSAIVCVPNKIVIHYGTTPDFKQSIDVYTW
jgi:hypothetical protein